MSFICKESDIVYIDKELFTYENKEFSHYFGAMAEAYFDNKLKDASVNVQRKTGNIML